ncbi:MAG: hypothetical protein UU03_C0025G0006 [Candidatus Woesebacteria bacterium GW2011_GWA1_40_45]|uniref:Uncharacterized protein n=1 Tax=Candidatus Woesebacteria bacterium GW2011_GWA1_40_45 TaxID=1618554 RepID=A0A0G0VIH1_9BACT|nr:MAG: hypothetical protein UU03_C0025G0006 [Candidatus Woesebacteria bacterium GW2011_GWA1_40_45]
MYSNDSNNMKVEKRFHGGNRKGFRWDKKLEALAKAPILGRYYKPQIRLKHE